MQQTKPQQEDLLVWFLKVWDRIEDNYIPILIGVGIALIAALIFVFFHQEHTQRARDAREALGSVYIALSQDRTADAIATSHDVMATYAGEAAAAEALMTLANLHFEEGDIAEARRSFKNIWMRTRQKGHWDMVHGRGWLHVSKPRANLPKRGNDSRPLPTPNPTRPTRPSR